MNDYTADSETMTGKIEAEKGGQGFDARGFPDVIAAHEAGHVVALAAAGLADEFTRATIVPQNGVHGLTVRSGASLFKLSGELTGHSQRIAGATGADQRAAVKAFGDFILTTPAVCLPHVCFFFGGGACDRMLGRESAARNSIDVNCVNTMVLPAMVLPPLADGDLRQVQSKIDAFLFKVFERERALLVKVYNALVERKTIDRASIGQEIMDDMRACAKRASSDYSELLKWFEAWHAGRAPKFAQMG